MQLLGVLRRAAVAAAFAAMAVQILAVSAAPSATASCSGVANNLCFPGNDLHILPGKLTAAQCCQACLDDKQCVCFTLNHDSKRGNDTEVLGTNTTGTCRLKSNVAQKTHGHCTSGLSGRPLPPAPPPPGPPGPPAPPLPPANTSYCQHNKCRNVLYLVADDMRADWHAYGLPVHTPNLDKLRQNSLLYEHAYCQLSVCAPSRMSFMTSLRPDTNKVWNFIDTNPLDSLATPGWFKSFNYLTYGLGKTFHQDSGAWNAERYWSPDFPYYPYGVGSCP